MKRAESKTVKRSGIRLYLFEDSHQDMGLLQSIFDNWRYIFKVMDDYIAWVLGYAEARDNKYVIKTENGSPYHLTLAALVHELTHIGQSDHLDCRKMRAQYGLLLLEGQVAHYLPVSMIPLFPFSL